MSDGFFCLGAGELGSWGVWEFGSWGDSELGSWGVGELVSLGVGEFMDLTTCIYFSVFAKLEAEAISLWVCEFMSL